jgi:hypothetical protein
MWTEIALWLARIPDSIEHRGFPIKEFGNYKKTL